MIGPGRAAMILKSINDEGISDGAKMKAIQQVLETGIPSGVKKSEIVEVLRYLYRRADKGERLGHE